jgi:hypothetical protein
MKYFKHPYIALAVLFAGVAGAGAIKNWNAGEPITATQLNAALNHIHTAMVGGHGARLVNADVAGNANIASSKLADGTMIPYAKAAVGSGWQAPCISGSCELHGARNVSSAVHLDAGTYLVTLSSAIAQPSTIICTSGSTVGVCNMQSNVNDGGVSNEFYVFMSAIGTQADYANMPFNFVIWNDGNQ